MRLTNRRQRIVIVSGLVLFVLLGLFPPWQYADGDFIGFRPVFAPPPPTDETIRYEDIPQEYLPIMIVPQSLYQGKQGRIPDESELRKPYLDIRAMLGAGAAIFLGGTLLLILLSDRRSATRGAMMREK